MMISQFPTPDYIAIDPGDRWVGMATLQQRAMRKFLLTARVFDRETDLFGIVKELQGPWHRTAHIIIEEYRVRPRRFNAFTVAETAQLIGALRYELGAHPNVALFFEPAASEKNLDLLPISEPILRWRKTWPPSGYWGHALSAWRVLGHHMLRMNPKLLGALSKPKLTIETVMIDRGRAMVIAPGEVWEIK